MSPVGGGSTGSGLNGSVFADAFSSSKSQPGSSFNQRDQAFKDSAQTAMDFALGEVFFSIYFSHFSVNINVCLHFNFIVENR